MDIVTAGLLVCFHGSGPGSPPIWLLGPARSENLTDAVVNPVTVRPIAAGEESIRDIYRANLTGLYRKLAE
ncbi:MAG: hypothetical protein PHU37_08970 [Methanoculleus chikugoensis]|nr:hypothetical protein [Methanoculleus chikugoensis]